MKIRLHNDANQKDIFIITLFIDCLQYSEKSEQLTWEMGEQLFMTSLANGLQVLTNMGFE